MPIETHKDAQHGMMVPRILCVTHAVHAGQQAAGPQADHKESGEQQWACNPAQPADKRGTGGGRVERVAHRSRWRQGCASADGRSLRCQLGNVRNRPGQALGAPGSSPGDCVWQAEHASADHRTEDVRDCRVDRPCECDGQGAVLWAAGNSCKPAGRQSLPPSPAARGRHPALPPPAPSCTAPLGSRLAPDFSFCAHGSSGGGFAAIAAQTCCWTACALAAWAKSSSMTQLTQWSCAARASWGCTSSLAAVHCQLVVSTASWCPLPAGVLPNRPQSIGSY